MIMAGHFFFISKKPRDGKDDTGYMKSGTAGRESKEDSLFRIRFSAMREFWPSRDMIISSSTEKNEIVYNRNS